MNRPLNSQEADRTSASRRLLASVLLCCSGLSACMMSTTPVRDQTFGQSTQKLRALQTLNAHGTSAEEAAQGVDAKAALQAQERYEQSFASPPKTGESLVITKIGSQ